MTNREIIMQEQIIRDIPEEIHTFLGWQKRGYKVRKGEKSIAKFPIWKQVYRRNKETEEMEQKMILVNSCFFAKSQVERA